MNLELQKVKTIVENNTSMNSDNGHISERQSRRRKKKAKSQKLRMEGKQYLFYTKSKKSKKETKSYERLSIFTKFWSDLNWDLRKVYVVAHITSVNTKRKMASDDSRRAETLIYTLTLNNIKYPLPESVART
nr:unnamed protein product [Callosobruchus chinensis]